MDKVVALYAARLIRARSTGALSPLDSRNAAIGSPISNLVHTLDGLISGLVFALQERVDQLQAAEGGA